MIRPNQLFATCGPLAAAALLTAFAAIIAAHPAVADDGACAAVLAAARSVGTAPQYRSVLVATWPSRQRPVESEQIVVGDLIYATSPAAGRWMKLPMTAADREHLSAGLVRYPPHHCEADPAADGTPMRIYRYRQDVSGPDSAASRLWVSGQDGLLRRLESQEGNTHMVITLEYENVRPPDLHEPAQPGSHGQPGDH